MSLARHTLAGSLCIVLGAAVLAGCGGGTSSASSDMRPAEPDVVRQGDFSLRMQAMQTDRLPEAVAAAHGVTRSRRDVLVLIALRQGEDAVATSPPGEVTIEVRDLMGRNRPVALAPMVSGELIDHVGTLRITPPETLRFEVRAMPEGSEPLDMRITRDFLP